MPRRGCGHKAAHRYFQLRTLLLYSPTQRPAPKIESVHGLNPCAASTVETRLVQHPIPLTPRNPNPFSTWTVARASTVEARLVQHPIPPMLWSPNPFRYLDRCVSFYGGSTTGSTSDPSMPWSPNPFSYLDRCVSLYGRSTTGSTSDPMLRNPEPFKRLNQYASVSMVET